MINPSLLLRRALLADAVFSGVSAVGLPPGAGLLAPFLTPPEGLLRGTGGFPVALTPPGGRARARPCVCRGLVLSVVLVKRREGGLRAGGHDAGEHDEDELHGVKR